ncbi:uncharacterized protein LOC118433183 isoform X2 [Folsomia candida]|uniref:DUF4806 domain-containing protein n=1 Tax=Folsomia candida TaxID=158441 RepID=A0A226D1B4_FOLCA|nr:uncharacterized protein LOC118433183 isoform X2 [Folsomia candida]OXA38850.1 hypothetical protein Fcan01_26363 [Folsomia candida]
MEKLVQSADQSDKTFTVVEFHLDNGVSVVPGSWISEKVGKKFCPFPDPIPKDFESIQSNLNSVPGQDWITYEVTCVRVHDNYKRAQGKAKKHIRNQQVDSTDAELGRGKRFRKNEEVLVTPAVSEPPPSLLHQINSGSSRQVNGPAKIPNDQQLQTLQIPYIRVEADQQLSELFSEFRNFQEESLRNQAFLLERVQNLENLLLNSLQNRGANSRWAGWKWPIKTTADVDAVELWLLDPRNYQEEVLILSKVGGNSGGTKCVYDTLDWMICHQLALTLRYTSKSGKTAVGDKLFVKLTRESVRLSNPGLTDRQINRFIASWFRQSSQRDKSRNENKTCHPTQNTATASGEGGHRGTQENSNSTNSTYDNDSGRDE